MQTNFSKKSRLTGTLLLFSLLLICVFMTGCSSSPASEQPSHSQTSETTTPNDQDAAKPNTTLEEPNLDNNSSSAQAIVPGQLKVHFIDVGQADAILIQLPNKQNMLIDAGNNADADFVENYIKKAGIKKIDFLVGTHPHEDHIGGLDAVIRNFDIGKVILPDKAHTSQTFRDVLLAIKNKGLKITKATAGKTLLDENGLTIKILAPAGTGYEDMNNYSAVIKLTFGNTSFLFQGDAEDVSEGQILAGGANVKADVLKVGHHGSNSSTTRSFLSKVDPDYAVISVGNDNDYGHPTKSTLGKLEAAKVKTYRTDLDGTLIFISDGSKITVKKSTLRHP